MPALRPDAQPKLDALLAAATACGLSAAEAADLLRASLVLEEAAADLASLRETDPEWLESTRDEMFEDEVESTRDNPEAIWHDVFSWIVD